jgi:hypothetical protein
VRTGPRPRRLEAQVGRLKARGSLFKKTGAFPIARIKMNSPRIDPRGAPCGARIMRRLLRRPSIPSAPTQQHPVLCPSAPLPVIVSSRKRRLFESKDPYNLILGAQQSPPLKRPARHSKPDTRNPPISVSPTVCAQLCQPNSIVRQTRPNTSRHDS